MEKMFVRINYYTEKQGFIGWDFFILTGVNYLSVYDEMRRDTKITFVSVLESIIRELEIKTKEKVLFKVVY